jgi:alpha-galactosidase
LIANSQCAFIIGGKKYLQSQLVVQSVTQSDLTDAFGSGKLIQVLSNTPDGTITITHNYYLYVDKDYILTDFTIESAQILSTNYMSPVNSATSTKFLPVTNNRMMFVPFDNDSWIRYNSINFGTASTSYEVGALYNTDTRLGLIIGSIEHTLWKTGIVTSTNLFNSLVGLEVHGGITSTVSHDILPHGMVKGHSIKSPKILIGYFSDWRTGMETYADVNAIVAPGLSWNGKKPFGWNSWGVIQTGLSYQNATQVSDYISKKLEPNNFSNDSTVYIGLDSYWDNISNANLVNFVNYCKARGQKAGIYWAPFVDWAKDPNRAVEGATGYYYKDIYLYANGQPQLIDGAYAIDPTHLASKLRAELFLNRFKSYGFKYLKLDFMTHGSLEADSHYDSTVYTGIQAYNRGLQHIVNYLGNTMFLNLSISPLFPSNYAHGRRIACDAYSSISDTEYTLNSLTYGWWLDHVYSYNDADNVVLNGVTVGENRARITSSVITGIFLVGDDYSTTGPQIAKDRAVLYLTNPEVNRIARLCKAFRPVEPGTGLSAANMFISQYADTTYIALFNYTIGTKQILLDFNRIGLNVGTTYEVNELWGNTTSERTGSWTESLPGMDAWIYKIYPKKVTATDQIKSNPEFLCYPNPCSGVLEVQMKNGQKIKDISIYSLLGVKVRQFVEPSASILLNDLKSGVYVIQATSLSGDISTSSLVKK